ncbi:D-alanyl-D-alanine carboxypeptidase (penicillin-binding protein 5/6) [Hydrocarboniphaga daqingensis]|uniref:serine-type D-Ala-D-Ala carboxypeptidase n=1 Tax=Hydrocarboniphaga daqingensis TaxID=490188 RepID=A0A1M5JXT5_9GAMM|nr:D-alanyl-D-alanine carboxypeptidase family protein [Hydrocarboniphaga daqingensis]SHG45366.1 D-alanyl-D-alanine carboxypeptidase (penicillin-binding protein 5/6) [Hydrocarboniphaga daqingensis]
MKTLLKRTVFVALLLNSLHAHGQLDKIPEPPSIDSKSFALIDFASGDLLAGKDPDARIEPASITKVMTTYIAFDEIKRGRLHYDDEALISEKAWRQGIDSSESRMFLDVGSRVKIIDLLRGIIIASGNDASIALSEHIAGSESAFAELMNQYAAKLGMKNTHFVDASGLPDPDHYTTARDLAMLGRALIRDFPEDYKIYSEREFKYKIARPQQNRNGLLVKDSSVDGIKTGHTNAAGYCLLSSSVRNGRRLISAVMGAKTWAYREQASLELLNYGFRFYEMVPLLGPGKPVATIPAYKGEQDSVQVGTLQPVSLSLPRGAKDRVQMVPRVTTQAVAPIEPGQVVGTIAISLDGKLIRQEPLVALTAVPEGGLFTRAVDTVRLWWAGGE